MNKRAFTILAISLLPSFVDASPFLQIEDRILVKKINEVAFECSSKIHINAYPISSKRVLKLINDIKNSNQSEECINQLSDIEKDLNNIFFKNKRSIGINSGSKKNINLGIYDPNIYKSRVYFKESRVIGDYALNIKVSKEINSSNVYFDESFLMYKYKNQIFTIGRHSRWWSSSKNSSLIMSNTSRPMPGISIRNFEPLKFKNYYLQYLGYFDYEIFINKLESSRKIPNALLFGNRVTFSPSNWFDFSLFRVAQFGGDDRPSDSKTIWNMLIGNDTTSSKLESDEQPGNQIAGIDFRLSLRSDNRLELYGQYVGEDGLDPIIDDRWIGAIFPSKRFGLIGLNNYIHIFGKDLNINIEHLDTYAEDANVAYNHSIYQSGYRYKNKPIGASIDADSDRSIISIEGNYASIKFSKSKINKNNSEFNSINNEYFDIDEIRFEKNLKIKSNIHGAISYVYRKSSNIEFDNDIILFNIEYRYD